MQSALAHQGHDDRAAHQIIACQSQTANHRQVPAVEQVIVFIQRFRVLAVGRANTSNGRDSQGDQIAIGLGAVALKIAMQSALALGHCERIVR